MKIRTELALRYCAILFAGFLLIGAATYYEIVVEHPGLRQELLKEHHTVTEEFLEIMFFGGLPALILALVGGWILMRRLFKPIEALTRAVEHVHADNLGQQLPRLGTGDEMDRLNEVFNSMMNRLNDSFAHVRDFTLHASHELKTPLTILRGEIETKLRDSTVSTADREFFASQLEEIGRLTKIVDALTLLTKADTGQLTVQNEPVRLDELVRDSFADTQMLAQSALLQVNLSACDQATVRGDRHRLRQLLLNLTDNAVKYNEKGGSIGMSLVCGNGTVKLTVINTGPGIAAEKLPRVFERFYRGDAAHSSEVEGCGLGLSIAEKIVKVHGATIHLDSKPAGLTTVEVIFPAVSQQSPPR